MPTSALEKHRLFEPVCQEQDRCKGTVRYVMGLGQFLHHLIYRFEI